MRSRLRRLALSSAIRQNLRNEARRVSSRFPSINGPQRFYAVAAKSLPRESRSEENDNVLHTSHLENQIKPLEAKGHLSGDGEVNRQTPQVILAQQKEDVSTVQQLDSSCMNILAANTTDIQYNRREWESWRKDLSTFEHYQFQSDVGAENVGQRLLINDKSHKDGWILWLELIRFRRRHYGAEGTQGLFKELISRNMLLPTSGILAGELWDLVISACHQDSSFLHEVLSYALRMKETTGRAWPELYYSVLSQALRTDPILAYSVHVRLKKHFPPSVTEFRKLFQECSLRDNVNDFEGLYRDLPLHGMYSTVISELCRRQNHRDAVKWHNLLFTYGDFPLKFTDIHPLLTCLAHKGDDRTLEQIANDLKQACGEGLPIPNAAERFIRKHSAIGREIFNRKLGEVHGVAPKHLSDSFCARLFATKLFSIDTIISGLQIVAADVIGPLAMRELARRDTCDTAVICRQIARLKEAGISFGDSAFSILFQQFVSKGETALLKSLTECDLHPDALEDKDLQERLLVQYYGRSDRLQFERTLAAITVRCRREDLLKWRLNLTLRCQISLRRTEAVISILETMKRNNIPITRRSSRHLRVCWLSKRRPGRNPDTTKELSIIINTSMSTLDSGRHVPITAWREIMRRLGMAGHLEELEILALWLIDFYIDRTAQQKLPIKVLLTDDNRIIVEHPQVNLPDLFTIAAQHGIVAWGFQQAVKGSPKMYRIRAETLSPAKQRPSWLWGLVLLQKLRARGIPIHQATVAQICTNRLKILFGQGVSSRRINRRSRWIQNQHESALNRWALRFYIREMRRVWGKDLFRQKHKASLIRSLPEPSRPLLAGA